MVDASYAPDNASTVFGILAHQRRRCALRCLREHENPMALADLADEVAARENETPLAEIPAEEVKRVYLSLYHGHIPKLADAKFIRYDQKRDLVTLSERAEQLTRYREPLTVE